MCWPDRKALENLAKLRDQFGYKRLIETGAAEGNGVLMYSRIFPEVHSYETNPSLYEIAASRTTWEKGQKVYCLPSPTMLGAIDRNLGPSLFILDAHTPGSWPILDELKAMKGFRGCSIVIHDFKVEGLGHINYDGQALDLDLVKDDLLRVDPNFYLYVNSRETCDIWTRAALKEHLGATYDKYFDKAMDFVWSAPVKTYRGILYAVPAELDESYGLTLVRRP